ncbi:hypothetical protein Misp01_73170 [Microtetraspora sp. NBRC 13810]|nr:hypothetical protein Misp01_73170 [Microtetraspora sp. NBRC 13810]
MNPALYGRHRGRSTAGPGPSLTGDRGDRPWAQQDRLGGVPTPPAVSSVGVPHAPVLSSGGVPTLS